MNRIVRWGLAVLSSVLLSLPWLGLPGEILFVALLPLLYIDDFFVSNKEKYRSVSLWGYSLLTVFLWNLITTWWIAHASVVGAAMAIITNSFLMSLVWWLAHIARRRFKGNLGYFTLVVFYLAFEFCHYHWDIEWPWLTLGNGFANNVKIIQWYEFTGVFGGSLWVLAVNVLLYSVLKMIAFKNRGRIFYAQAIFLLLLVVVPVTVSELMYSRYTEQAAPKEFVVVQPNIDPYAETYSMEAENQKLQKVMGLAWHEAGSNTSVVVAPETVVERYPEWNEERIQYIPAYMKIAGFLANFPKTDLLMGVSSSKIYQEGEAPSVTARKKGELMYDVYNSAFLFKRDGTFEVYHKSILVSGVEKVPYMKYLGFLRNVIIDLGGASGNLGRQDEASVFTASDSTVMAPVICYESVFGEYLTDFVRKGAQFIVIITNDGWWKNTPGYRQHMSFARLRAIETRRSIARSANTGISCFINQRGDELQKTQWWTETVIKANLNANNSITFYARNGDFIGRVAAFMAVLLVMILLSDKLRKKMRDQPPK